MVLTHPKFHHKGIRHALNLMRALLFFLLVLEHLIKYHKVILLDTVPYIIA